MRIEPRGAAECFRALDPFLLLDAIRAQVDPGGHIVGCPLGHAPQQRLGVFHVARFAAQREGQHPHGVDVIWSSAQHASKCGDCLLPAPCIEVFGTCRRFPAGPDPARGTARRAGLPPVPVRWRRRRLQVACECAGRVRIEAQGALERRNGLGVALLPGKIRTQLIVQLQPNCGAAASAARIRCSASISGCMRRASVRYAFVAESASSDTSRPAQQLAQCRGAFHVVAGARLVHVAALREFDLQRM